MPTVRRTWAPRGQTPVIRHRYRRDKISAISAISVSPHRHHCSLYAHFHFDNITHVEVAVFLRELLRHLRGHVIVVWDGGSVHSGADVRQVLTRHPRLHVERFPAYAPELNPDELVWGYLKGRMANAGPDDVDELMASLSKEARRLGDLPGVLRAFVVGSELPFVLP